MPRLLLAGTTSLALGAVLIGFEIVTMQMAWWLKPTLGGVSARMAQTLIFVVATVATAGVLRHSVLTGHRMLSKQVDGARRACHTAAAFAVARNVVEFGLVFGVLGISPA